MDNEGNCTSWDELADRYLHNWRNKSTPVWVQLQRYIDGLEDDNNSLSDDVSQLEDEISNLEQEVRENKE